MTSKPIPVYTIGGQPLQPITTTFSTLAELQAAISKLYVQDFDAVIAADQDFNQMTHAQLNLSVKMPKFVVVGSQREGVDFRPQIAPMRIFVRKTNRRGAAVNLSPYSSLQDLKQFIQTRFSIPCDCQNLYYCGQKLTVHSQTSLLALGVSANRVLHIVDRRNILSDVKQTFSVVLDGARRSSPSHRIDVKGEDTINTVMEAGSLLFDIPKQFIVVSYCSMIVQDTESTLFENEIQSGAHLKILDDRQAIVQEIVAPTDYVSKSLLGRYCSQDEIVNHPASQEYPKVRKTQSDECESIQTRRGSNDLTVSQLAVTGSHSQQTLPAGSDPILQQPHSTEELDFQKNKRNSLDLKGQKGGREIDSRSEIHLNYSISMEERASKTRQDFKQIHFDVSVSDSASNHAPEYRRPIILGDVEKPQWFEFDLQIRDFQDNLYKIHVSEVETGYDMKQKLMLANPHLTIDRIEILLEGRVLEDIDVLKDLGINQESAVYIVIRD